MSLCAGRERAYLYGTSLDLLCQAGFDAPSSVDIEADLIECEERMEQSARVREAIKQLNERQQYIIREVYFNGRTQAEVSRVLGIDKTSISKALARELASLKKILKKKLKIFLLGRQLFKLFVLVVVKG